MPDVFVHKAIGKEGGAGSQGERGVVCSDNETMANIKAIHVKRWRGERRAALVSVLERVDPASVTAQEGAWRTSLKR